MKIHHIGYLVEDMDAGIKEFEQLGYTKPQTGIQQDDDRGILICFMHSGGVTVELITPVWEQSAVSGIYKKKGAGPYHICYLSADLSKDTQMLINLGFMVISPPAPASALQNKSVVFLFNKNSGIIELLQE